MSDTAEPGAIPAMAQEQARRIARGFKWLAQSYAAAGMAHDASRAERDSQRWLDYALSLAPAAPHNPA